MKTTYPIAAAIAKAIRPGMVLAFNEQVKKDLLARRPAANFHAIGFDLLKRRAKS